MEQYYLYGFIALGVLLIIAFIMIYLLYGKLNRIQKKQLRLDEKLSGKKAEDLLYDVLEEERELKRELNRAVGYKGVQLVTISRPTAYGEYAPYHFVDTEQEFQALVKGLRPKD